MMNLILFLFLSEIILFEESHNKPDYNDQIQLIHTTCLGVRFIYPYVKISIVSKP